MSQYHCEPVKAFVAGEAIPQHARVKLSAGKVVKAGATDVEIGTAHGVAFADGDTIAVLLRTAEGTRKMLCAGAITTGNPVYAAAAGKIDSAGTVYCGTALEEATATGDVIETLPGPNTDLSSAIASTNAAAFKVDADATTPKLAISGQSGGTGDYTTTLKPETALAGNNAIIVPEADGDTLVAVALAQTLTNKTLASSCVDSINATPVAAAGTTVADAGQLPTVKTCYISSASAAAGVKLPTGAAGDIQLVINTSATAAKFYAASGGTVNGLAANAAVVIPASKGLLCVCSAADTWVAFDLPARATAA